MATRPRRSTAEQRLSEAWKAIWQSPHGRVAISELLVSNNVYSEIVASDPVMMAIAVGERNVAARIARHIGLKAESYVDDAQAATDLVGRFIDASETTY